MYDNCVMLKETLDRSDRSFIEGANFFFPLQPDSLTPDEIKDLNNTAYSQRIKNKYLVKAPRSISSTTFIIPVADGSTITSYYLVNQKLQEKGNIPLVIFFHGGGWFHSNLDFYSTYLKHFAASVGCAVLLVDYRLGQSYKFPTAIEDCYDSVLWAMEGVKYWKIDTDRIYIAGDGFGATLAATTSILLRDRKGPQPNGVLLLYPMTDGRLRTQSMESYKETPVLTQKMLGWYIKNYSREVKDSLSPLMSPLLTLDLSRLPQTLIIGAEIDPLRDDALLYKEALENGGTKANVLIADGAMHGFLPFKKAKGRKECERVIWLFINGKNADSITFVSQKELKKLKKGKS